jgi:hypothetical protein
MTLPNRNLNSAKSCGDAADVKRVYLSFFPWHSQWLQYTISLQARTKNVQEKYHGTLSTFLRGHVMSTRLKFSIKC